MTSGSKPEKASIKLKKKKKSSAVSAQSTFATQFTVSG